MVDFEAIREVSNAGSTFVCVRDDDNLVSAVDEFRRELVDVAFDAAWLGKEVVADHRNIVRHGAGEGPPCARGNLAAAAELATQSHYCDGVVIRLVMKRSLELGTGRRAGNLWRHRICRPP